MRDSMGVSMGISMDVSPLGCQRIQTDTRGQPSTPYNCQRQLKNQYNALRRLGLYYTQNSIHKRLSHNSDIKDSHTFVMGDSGTPRTAANHAVDAMTPIVGSSPFSRFSRRQPVLHMVKKPIPQCKVQNLVWMFKTLTRTASTEKQASYSREQLVPSGSSGHSYTTKLKALKSNGMRNSVLVTCVIEDTKTPQMTKHIFVNKHVPMPQAGTLKQNKFRGYQMEQHPSLKI